jgi:serine/threonine protein kinase
MPLDWKGQHTRQRFLRDLKAATNLADHPNIAPILSSGVDNSGNTYVVTEFCSAGSLASTPGPLAVPTVLSLGVRIAAGLNAAHAAGVMHGDVKPSNILLAENGEPMLSDFAMVTASEGLGATVDDASAAVHRSPEALQHDEYTAADDVWSLASTLYSLLLGRAPFAGKNAEDSMATALRVMSSPLPPLGRDDVPPDLEACLARALAKDPANRIQTPIELASYLCAVEASAGLPRTTFHGGVLDPTPPHLTSLPHQRDASPLESVTQLRGDAPPSTSGDTGSRLRRGTRWIVIGVAGAVLAGGSAGVAVAVWPDHRSPAPTVLSGPQVLPTSVNTRVNGTTAFVDWVNPPGVTAQFVSVREIVTAAKSKNKTITVHQIANRSPWRVPDHLQPKTVYCFRLAYIGPKGERPSEYTSLGRPQCTEIPGTLNSG